MILAMFGFRGNKEFREQEAKDNWNSIITSAMITLSITTRFGSPQNRTQGLLRKAL